jgi:hypothetical protein
VTLRPLRTSKDPKAIDEGTDTYDTIDWMIKNVPNNNGRVDVWNFISGLARGDTGVLEPHPL